MPIKIKNEKEAFIVENGESMTIEELMEETGLGYHTIYSIAKRRKVIPKDSGWFRGYIIEQANRIIRVKGEYSNSSPHFA